MINEDGKSPDDVERRISRIGLRDAVHRATSLSFVLALAFGLYGASSLDFVKKFKPTISFWDNIWPRLLIGFIPFLLLGLFLGRSKARNHVKLLAWIVGFSLILHASAWIYVWPIALGSAPDILAYVNPANVFLYAVVFAIIAPPGRYLAIFASVLSLLFIAPLLLVAYMAGDLVIFRTIMNDSVLALGVSVFLSRTMHQIRAKVAKLEIEREIEATKFLGPVLSKAIYENETRRLQSVRCEGYVISIDVRDSTDLQAKHGVRWLDFRKDYFSLASRVVAKHGGYIQKTVGDAHVINFGVMDYGVDLSDIPGVETELARAEERRVQQASQSAFAFLEEFLERAGELAVSHFPEECVVLGAGIDRGMLERGVQGDAEHALELDVNGDSVNCSNRLQEYSKRFRAEFPESSILAVSPHAADFLTHLDGYVKAQTVEQPIRNYATIRWVLVRSFTPLSKIRQRLEKVA